LPHGFLERKPEATSVLPIPVLVSKSVGSKNELRIPISILSSNKKKTVATTAIIDSGAGGTFISDEFVKKHQIKTRPLAAPFNIRTVDGSYSTAGKVSQYCVLMVRVDQRVMIGKFNITRLGRNDDIILGYPWLARVEPKIDWVNKTLTLESTERS
jgi:hypothetical protein